MLENLRNQLEQLEDKEIQVVAVGQYPTGQKTKVSDVAHYQNDGTERIEASHFVERSANDNGNWQNGIFSAVGEYLEGKEDNLERRTPRMIADDISDKCDRIKTTRLKYSFRSRIIQK